MQTSIVKFIVVSLSVALLSGCGNSKKSKTPGAAPGTMATGSQQTTQPQPTSQSTSPVASSTATADEPVIDSEVGSSTSDSATNAGSTADNGQTVSNRDRRNPPVAGQAAPSATPAPVATTPAAPISAPTQVATNQAPVTQPSTPVPTPAAPISATPAAPTTSTPAAPSVPAPSSSREIPVTSKKPSSPESSKPVSGNGSGYLDFSQAEAIKTGAVAGELAFTGASEDALVADLRKLDAQDQSSNEEQNKKDLNLAKIIASAKAVHDMNGELKRVDLVLSETKEQVRYILNLKNVGDHYEVDTYSTVNAKGQAQGEHKITAASVKCLNLEANKCSQLVARVKIDDAAATIIIRKTDSRRYFMIQKNGKSVPLKVIRDYIYNTIGNVKTVKKIATMTVASYEVVNGRSAMGVLLTMADRESVAFNIPLVAPEKGGVQVQNVKVPVVKTLAEHYELPEGPHSKFNIYSKIKKAELVNNNGLGQVKVKFDVSDAKVGEANIWVIISRKAEKLMSNSDVVEFVKASGI